MISLKKKGMGEHSGSKNGEPGSDRWTLAMTVTLLEQRDAVLAAAQKREPHRKPSMTPVMWKEVARRIHDVHSKFTKSGTSCKNRFNNMKTAYRGRIDRERVQEGDSGDGGPFEPAGSPSDDGALPTPDSSPAPPVVSSLSAESSAGKDEAPVVAEPATVKKETPPARPMSEDVFVLMNSRFGRSPATRTTQLGGSETTALGRSPPPPNPFVQTPPLDGASASDSSTMTVSQQGGSVGGQRRKTNKSGNRKACGRAIRFNARHHGGHACGHEGRSRAGRVDKTTPA